MYAARISAITFALFVVITMFFPFFPPAQLLYEYARISQTTLSLWGFSIATLLNSITNGFFWAIIVGSISALAQLALQERKQMLLPSIPRPIRLATPPPENILVDSRVSRIPPALTVPQVVPLSTWRKEPFRSLTTSHTATVLDSREPVDAEKDVENIEGLGPICHGLLRSAGIYTVNDLLRVGATEGGRHRIANEVGVTSATVLRWVYRGDLLRVNGIGRKYSALLELAGVKTVQELSNSDSFYLWQRLNAVNVDQNLVKQVPSCKTIEIWVQKAKHIEPLFVE
jgi:predicted flap endonuclease-1-like 5' DNA nuclease